MAFSRPLKLERVYVKVSSIFDSHGYMQPSSITWKDGRTFKIDEVRDVRPAVLSACSFRGDCFTVIIHGETRYLYYERPDPRFSASYGRWFVECYA